MLSEEQKKKKIEKQKEAKLNLSQKTSANLSRSYRGWLQIDGKIPYKICG